MECVGLALTAVFVWAFLLWLDPDLRRWREFDRRVSAREPLSDQEMFARYFSAGEVPPEVPAQVRMAFARHMDYSAEKLWPDDDLAFFWAELDMSELIEELESGFGVAITQEEGERTPCTIRAVTILFAKKAGLLRLTS